ncbi:MAG: NAD(P)-binding protein [Bacillota bacterium]
MKVAVIGAGAAGLSCAHELERHGITPEIFEQRHRPGELFDHAAAVLEIFTRPNDPLKDLKKNYYLELKPIGKIKKIIMKTPQKKSVVKGDLGYFIMRGGDPTSVESQLYRAIKSKITTNTRVNYTDIYKKYDYVVVANGGYDMSRNQGILTTVFPAKLIGGTVIGDFDMDSLIMWLDTRYSKSAYGYLAPMEKRRAFLGLVVPESSVNEARDKWKLFWEMESHPYDQVNEIIIEHNAGFVYPHQVGNLLFAGIAGGFQEPFLGFGLSSAIKSGVLAGRAIASGKIYEDLLVQLKEDMKHSLIFREMMNTADNKDYDRLVSAIGKPGIKQVTYNTNIDFVRMGSAVIAHAKNAASKLKTKIKI